MQPLLQVENLHVRFPVRSGVMQRVSNWLNAVNGVEFQVYKGEAFGIVGESGCGKTTLARAILRLLDASQGRIFYDGHDITRLERKALVPFRRKIQAIFQDPYSSLNPRKTSEQIIGEPIVVHGFRPRQEVSARVDELLELCGLPKRFRELYPHEMSGGQRQRVGIARALAMEPELIVCDEAVSALDVSIQAQIINLLTDLREQLSLTYVFIGHDLSIVRHLCDRVAVMYLGRIVESAPSEQLFAQPLHPYTRALINAVPNPDPNAEADRMVEPLHGEVPSLAKPPKGCVFHPRCPIRIDKCQTEIPFPEAHSADRSVSCWRTDA